MSRWRELLYPAWLSRWRERRARRRSSGWLVRTDDRNGYVREDVVRALTRLAGTHPALAPDLLPALLWRTADWVGPVRQAALEGVRACLPHVGAAGLLRQVETLRRVRRAARAHPEVWPMVAGRLGELARTDDGRAWLAPTSDADARRFLWEVLLERPDMIEPDLWERAWADPVPKIRGLAVRHAPVAAWDAARWRRFLTGETMTSLRRDALRRLVAQRPQPDGVDDLYRAAAMDRSREVRETGRYALKTFQGIEPRAWYRQALEEHAPEVLIGLAAGLAETCDADDVPRFRAWLRHADDALRAAGLAGLARQTPDEAEGVALTFLDDPRRLPRKTAVWLLRTRPERAGEVRAVLRTGTPNGRKAAFRVLTSYPGLTRVLDILEGLTQPPLRRLAWNALGTWAGQYGWFAANARYTWRTVGMDVRAEAERRVETLVAQGLPRPDFSRLAGKVFHVNGGRWRPEPVADAVIPVDAWIAWNSLPAVLREWGV